MGVDVLVGDTEVTSLSEKLEERISDEVLKAVREKDWPRLRYLSMRPGGFGEARSIAWPFLLHTRDSPSSGEKPIDCVQPVQDSEPSRLVRRRGRSRHRQSNELLGETNEPREVEEKVASSSRLSSPSSERHPDEHQIKLDTDRSFVLYPTEAHMDRDMLQADLHNLITTVFRRHPKLSYFQGYHDIMTVLFLTLPDEEQLACAEKMSLHRLRDSMGKGLEPLVGLLRILKFLLRKADPDFARLLESNTPLPYFALSNLLTLFSHDVPTLPLIQHVFDYLLSRPPIASVYLAAAVILSRKEEVKQLEEDEEEGMLYSLMSSLPELVDGDVSVVPEKQEEASNPGSTDCIMPENDSKTGDEIAEESKVSQSVEGTDAAIESITSASEIAKPHLAAKGDDAAEGENVSEEVKSEESDVTSNHSDQSSRPPTPIKRHARRAPIQLSQLLAHADTLSQRYPPSDPDLYIEKILGPKSVVFTWSEDPGALPSDADAESFATIPELVVRPFIDPDELSSKERAGGVADSREEKRLRRRLQRYFRRRRAAAKLGLDDRTVLLTGAVVTLGVAIAVYSVASSRNQPLSGERIHRELKKMGGCVLASIAGGSERILEMFGW